MNDNFNSLYWELNDVLKKKSIEQSERRQIHLMGQHKQQIRDKIKKHLQFSKKYVRNGRSKQDGSCHVFFDIILDKDSVTRAMNTMYDDKSLNKIERCNKARGRSYVISTYASYTQSLEQYWYIKLYVLQAIEEAYKEFIDGLLNSEYELEALNNDLVFEKHTCKCWPISWFNEVFISDEKFKTSAETLIEELEEKYAYAPELPKNMPEPTDREKTWIDRYIDFDTIEEFIIHCHDIMDSPDTYAGLKNYKDYIDEAQKIIGRRL